jgi:hypothetical protein
MAQVTNPHSKPKIRPLAQSKTPVALGFLSSFSRTFGSVYPVKTNSTPPWAQIPTYSSGTLSYSSACLQLVPAFYFHKPESSRFPHSIFINPSSHIVYSTARVTLLQQSIRNHLQCLPDDEDLYNRYGNKTIAQIKQSSTHGPDTKSPSFIL